ncbi:hypothetical protein [Kordiimonas marina]|uniref:hypothetical protein n=1 Tax=Kordiimonas marina TaxID=2872312 RepID=UPI001FF2C4A0|nr:hypothetical protein [Kordiimonas marina]MCJ9429315.1 hypothetical protein [Kordiimonas marina]
MAFFKGSYYQKLPVFDAADGRKGKGFLGVRTRPIAEPEPVLEHTVTVGDRLDSLGQHYYANPRDWRRLADCNPDAIFPEDLLLKVDAFPLEGAARERTGEVILVPRRREGQR